MNLLRNQYSNCLSNYYLRVSIRVCCIREAIAEVAPGSLKEGTPGRKDGVSLVSLLRWYNKHAHQALDLAFTVSN